MILASASPASVVLTLAAAAAYAVPAFGRVQWFIVQSKETS